ncbi:uncharacterized protein [Euphorbia lathyris]|uniref:uncharacterized protein isoform X1 n=1 Tax=Euphorbia lathyris TaxID=212925 RepID=UPI00331372DD
MSSTGDNDKTKTTGEGTSNAPLTVESLEKTTSKDTTQEYTASKPPIPKLGTKEARKRKPKSWVWEHFVKNNDDDDPRASSRDVLAIPVSTVASESAFSTGGRVLDSFRSALTPRIVEALVCAQNWLRCSSQPIHLDNILEQLEAINSRQST